VLKGDEMAGFTERLDCCPFSAVCARVAYQLIVLDYRHRPESYHYPEKGLRVLLRDLSADGWEAMACWITAYCWLVTHEGYTVKQARDQVVDRAMKAEANRRRGNPWARVPRSCPRVTNRGAASLSRRAAGGSGDEVPR